MAILKNLIKKSFLLHIMLLHHCTHDNDNYNLFLFLGNNLYILDVLQKNKNKQKMRVNDNLKIKQLKNLSILYKYVGQQPVFFKNTVLMDLDLIKY